MTSEGISRRHALTGAVAAAVGTPLLAACGGAPEPIAGSGGSDVKAGTALGPASDVPVGGGKVYGDQKIVVTQPTAGEFRGFSAVCTHQGCPVTRIADGTIDCMCHGSKFSVTDGSVVNGPATSPLAKVDVKVKGGRVTTA